MLVTVGNSAAIARIQQTDGSWSLEELSGDNETTVVLPDELSVHEAITDITGAISLHMVPGSKPNWVKCDNADVEDALNRFYGIGLPVKKAPAKKTTRRKTND